MFVDRAGWSRSRNRLTGALLAGGLALFGFGARGEDATEPDLDRLVQGEHRSEDHAERNRYRNPVETLTFFGIRPDMTVVEIAPGGAGWYTEILAPYLRDAGKLIVTGYDPDSENDYVRRNAAAFDDKMKARPDLYDQVEVVVMDDSSQVSLAPAGTVDMVLTFRNFHGWLESGIARDVVQAAHQALKPGGTFGVVQHRGSPGVPEHRGGSKGYVDEGYLIGFIEALGFELADSSEINANPADPKDHPEGVWALPPSLDGAEAERERMLGIGESDRMTLRFVKR